MLTVGFLKKFLGDDFGGERLSGRDSDLLDLAEESRPDEELGRESDQGENR